MAANPKDGLLKKINHMAENGATLDEQLDVAAEELNYRVKHNMSASYKNSAWHIVKMIAEKILAAKVYLSPLGTTYCKSPSPS